VSLVGQRINNYEVTRLLGEGGMGAVYVAQHPIIRRRVAIKVLRYELTKDETLVGRFINEARAASAIQHPNIVEIHDVGTLPDGVPYLVMELLEGESLGARLARTHRIHVGDAVEFAYQAAGALAAAHKEGIVHRDLKPDNLFLTPDPAMPGRSGAASVVTRSSSTPGESAPATAPPPAPLPAPPPRSSTPPPPAASPPAATHPALPAPQPQPPQTAPPAIPRFRKL
jgi:serine/threonine-protein kinase